ncbi:MAG: LuxR family transcriptional regulator [Gallionellaceae bacterium]|nr:MAG: LuxR family transcriptional regulator [Gallionellaceae bacterium]
MHLIIELYRAAQGMAVDEFQEFSLGLLKSLVPFNSAKYMGGVLTQQGMRVQEVYLHNEPVETVSDYAGIVHADPVLKAVRANPDKIVRFHPATLFAGRESRPLFDFAKRYEHANGMAIAHFDGDTPQVQALSLYRADADSHFLEQDCSMAEQVLPHFLEAIKINQALAVHRSTKDGDRSTLAIACPNGALHFCGAGFRKLLCLDWPDWESALLPGPLLDKLTRTGSTGYRSSALRVSVRSVGGLLFLKASRVSASAPCPAICPDLLRSAYGLTPAEARVAIAMLEDKSAREMADELGVSFHTVRVQIRQVYAKLGVNTRAGFVKLMLGLGQGL